MLTATVSGSFHRHLHAISTAVQELADQGVKVLSPADPRIVDSFGEFLFVASDRVRSVRLVQDRHVESIRSSDFLWLVAPDGYVGQSAAMELGFAVANAVPIVGLTLPADLTLRQYVHHVDSLQVYLQSTRPRGQATERFLIDPHASIETAHSVLERIDRLLKPGRGHDPQGLAADLYLDCERVSRTFRSLMV
jgi:hypothetical protein